MGYRACRSEYEPEELDDINYDLQRKNREVIKYVSHIRNVGKYIEGNRAVREKIASIPRSVSAGYKIIRVTQKEFCWLCKQGNWYRIYEVRGSALGDRMFKYMKQMSLGGRYIYGFREGVVCKSVHGNRDRGGDNLRGIGCGVDAGGWISVDDMITRYNSTA